SINVIFFNRLLLAMRATTFAILELSQSVYTEISVSVVSHCCKRFMISSTLRQDDIFVCTKVIRREKNEITQLCELVQFWFNFDF
ncbi:MAG: hypothetical protein ACOVQN_00675, partial [Exiguobacterium sp.]